MNIPFPWLVFDVESVGLYGDPFAVGYVLMDENGEVIRKRWHGANLEKLPGFMFNSIEDIEWCWSYIPQCIKDGNCSLDEMYSSFVTLLSSAIKQKYSIIADCPFPVETNFLRNCKLRDRTYISPYPLYDIASILAALGRNPLEEYPREEGETKHHPMWDAHQSARILYETIKSS